MHLSAYILFPLIKLHLNSTYVLLFNISINISWIHMQPRIHVYIYIYIYIYRLQPSVKIHQNVALHLATLATDRWSQPTNQDKEAERRGGCPYRVSLNGGGGRQLVPAHLSTMLGVDRLTRSHLKFSAPEHDISGLYPHRIMPHNAAASITRHVAAPQSSRISRDLRVCFFGGWIVQASELGEKIAEKNRKYNIWTSLIIIANTN